jgi:membrane protease YdiL (CAAX protease family)
VKRHPLLWFFLLTFGITWGLAVVLFAFPDFVRRVAGEMSSTNPLFILAVWGPNLAALIVTAAISGGAGVLALLERVVRFRVGVIWYLLALLLLPAAGILSRLVSGQPLVLAAVPGLGMAATLGMLLFTGTLGEEVGWRGFALPRLLARMSPLAASLLLGAVWGIWHLPSFFVSGLPQAGLAIPVFLLGALSLSVIATWILIHARGSVALSMLLHFSVNFTLNVLGMKLLLLGLFQAAAAVVLLAACGPRLSRKAKVEI